VLWPTIQGPTINAEGAIWAVRETHIFSLRHMKELSKEEDIADKMDAIFLITSQGKHISFKYMEEREWLRSNNWLISIPTLLFIRVILPHLRVIDKKYYKKF
jgi:HD superfamily phosphodiesterase